MRDYRFKPFENYLETKPLIDYHAIPQTQPHEIRLREIPEKANPTTIQVRFFAFSTDTKITASATTINVDFDLGNPFSLDEVITIDEESIKVTGIGATSISVLRGVDGTIPVEHTPKSTTEPIVIFGAYLGEVAAEPGTKQYRPDYSTNDDKWNTGTIRFNPADSGFFVEVAYDGIGCLVSAERAGNDSLKKYGYEVQKDICALIAGTVSLPSYTECQILYIRKGATGLRAEFPGMAFRVTNSAVVAGTLTSDGIVPEGRHGNCCGGGGNGGGNGPSYGLYQGIIEIGLTSPSVISQKRYLNSTSLPLFWGGGGTSGAAQGNNGSGGGGGGGIALISPYILLTNTTRLNARGNTGGNGWQSGAGVQIVRGSGGGGGAGGAIVLVSERCINSGAIFNVQGGGGGTGPITNGSAGPAGWVALLENGGRN